jgi:hypothetical protein
MSILAYTGKTRPHDDGVCGKPATGRNTFNMRLVAALAVLILCHPANGQEAPNRFNFDIVVSGGLRPTLHIKTNAPAGTHFVMDLVPPNAPDVEARLARGLPACVPDCLGPVAPDFTGIVRGGRFSIGPFRYKDGPLRPGVYRLQVWLNQLDTADPGVRLVYETDVLIRK